MSDKQGGNARTQGAHTRSSPQADPHGSIWRMLGSSGICSGVRGHEKAPVPTKRVPSGLVAGLTCPWGADQWGSRWEFQGTGKLLALRSDFDVSCTVCGVHGRGDAHC